jgi:hypothetical protein
MANAYSVVNETHLVYWWILLLPLNGALWQKKGPLSGLGQYQNSCVLFQRSYHSLSAQNLRWTLTNGQL